MTKIKFFSFALLFAMFATHAQEALILNKADGPYATSVMLDATRTISVTNQNDYSLESRYFLWKCGTEPLIGNISPENFMLLMSHLDFAYEAMQDLTGFTPENGRQVNIELLAEDDWAGGRGGGGYIGINRDWIGHYMREVERDGGAPNGLFLHELGHNFDWGTGQRWFNAEIGASVLASYVRDKLNLVFYHDYVGEAFLGSDWIDLEYTLIMDRYNRGETTKNDYEHDFITCLMKLFHETNWEPLKAVYHSDSDKFELWSIIDKLSHFCEIPVDTYFYPDLNEWLHKSSWEIGSPNDADVIATLENGILTITGSGAMQDEIRFSNKGNITNVIINTGVTNIGRIAFEWCCNLSSVSIPESVTDIGHWAFAHCKSLTSITIPSSVETIGSGVFEDCGNLALVIISNGVKTIGAYAFKNCNSLVSVAIPNSVTSIGFEAFYNCTSLTDVTVNWTTPLSIDDNVFANVDLSDVNLHVPLGTQNAYATAPVWKNFKLQTQTNTPDLQLGFTELKIYPNPAKNEIFIKSELQIKKIEIYSLTGVLLLSESNFNEKISLSTLPKGVYIVKIYTDNGIKNRKIVKE